MDYYSRRVKANLEINNLYADGRSDEEIEYIIDTKYGLSSRFVKKRIEKIIRMEAKANGKKRK